ncbi:MAG: (d)CMP kinase [Candidatus Hydrothermarchaeales archaeon]
MIVTVGGPIGSGKTTIAEALAEKFDLRHISAGRVFREMAEKMGMSLAEFSKFAEEHHELDREVDERQVEMAKEGNAIVDGRLSGWMLDADLKIWLNAPLKVRAKRVANREKKSFEVALRETKDRERSEKKRYEEIYDIDLDDLSVYDVILNTAKWDAEGVVEIIGKMISACI